MIQRVFVLDVWDVLYSLAQSLIRLGSFEPRAFGKSSRLPGRHMAITKSWAKHQQVTKALSLRSSA